MSNLGQSKRGCKQLQLCLVAVLVIMTVAFLRGKVQVKAAESTLTVLQKIDGVEYKEGKIYRAQRGQDVVLEIDASTEYANEDGEKKISYKWEIWDGDREGYIELGTDSTLKVEKGEDKEIYSCVVSDGNVEETYNFKLYPENTLSIKQYINDDETSVLENAAMNQSYVLKVDVKSSYANANLKYVWYVNDDEGEIRETLDETGSQITVKQSGKEIARYTCQISDGNQIKTVKFKIEPETLIEAEAFINGDKYDFSTVTIRKDKEAVLKLKVSTSSGVKPTYSWSKRDMSIPSSLGKEYLALQNTTATYTAKPTTDSYEEYRCIITVEGMDYERYFYIRRGTLSATGIAKVDNEILEDDGRSIYFVEKGKKVSFQVISQNLLSDSKLTYRWFKYKEIDETDEIEETEIKGENKEIYTFEANEDQDYYCLISNGQDSERVYFTIDLESDHDIKTEQYIQGEKTDSYSLDSLAGDIELKVKASSGTGENLKYLWYEWEDDDSYGGIENVLQEDGDTYILDCSRIKNKEIEISCKIREESDEKGYNSSYCTFKISLKNFTTGAKTYIKTATEETEINCITVAEGTPLTLKVEPAQNEKNLTYVWYDKNAKKQGEGKSISVTKGSAKDIYYCAVSDGNYTTRYTFTLKKEIICKHETVIKDKEIPATCTNIGWTEGSHCEDCGEIIKEQKVIPALGHNWDKGTITKNPTTTEKGIKTYKCKNAGCNQTKTEEIAKLSQNQNSSTNKKALKVGTKVSDKKTKATYKVTGKNTIEYVKPSSKNVTTVTIPATITINKVKYQVTSIAAKAMKDNKKLKKAVIPSNIKKIGTQAFSGCKNLKNITIKTTKLTSKTVGAKAFKGISAKAVIKVPKKQLKAYQKLLKAKGAGKTVKIKK